MEMVEKVTELCNHQPEALGHHHMDAKKEEIDSLPSKSACDEAPLLIKSVNQESQGKYEEGSASISPEELEAKYAAFVRHDVYGTFGQGTLPLKEKILLGLALVILLPIRVIVGILILLFYYLICRICTLLSVAETEEEDGVEHYGNMSGLRRSIVVGAGRFLSRALLFNFGFYWIKVNHRVPSAGSWSHEGNLVKEVEENDADADGNAYRPGAIISNHVSYLDILYHMSASFPSFVAKRSVAKIPLVGLISKCLGCVYVQRESKTSDFKGVSGIVVERLQAAHSNKFAPMMMLFPEGTTTNGEYLLPFKTGAFLAKTPVQPVILRYPYRRFSPAWDSISGVRHVILLLCQFVNYLEVTRLPVYCPSDKEKGDTRLYADNVRKLMALEGNLKMSDVGLPEKRIYHAALHGCTTANKPSVEA
eukprot:TRINITY_DN467_c0_g1_i1.p1 TRINITY_DN467_c0_g1~~TRINITY_DN467_c0_g1_i1.p1  ORF type:complete len:421 (-),score=57.46 TRINITY_DN467_c0_g1_i1:537-1799(-)